MSYAERTKRPPRTLTDAETKKILDVTGKAAAGFRDHMIISLAIGTGLRQSEIVELTIGDVTKADRKTPKRTIQLVKFKRAAAGADPSDHRVHLPDATFYKLEKYLRSIKAWEYFPDTCLFTSRKNMSLSTRAVRAMFHTWQERAGFDQLYNFHSLRHTAITTVRRLTKDIRVAQRFARHANIATTVRYEHISDQEVAAAVKGLPG
jgi:integrase/recombinase XerC